MRDGKDGMARAARIVAEIARDVDRLPGIPRGEAGRGQQGIERDHHLVALLLRVEALEIEYADLLKRRTLDAGDERGEVEVLTGFPGLGKNRSEKRPLAAFRGIGIGPQQAEQTGHSGEHALSEGFLVVHIIRARKALTRFTGMPAVLPGV